MTLKQTQCNVRLFLLATLVQTEMSEQLLDAMKFGTDIHVALGMNCNSALYSGDSFTFHQVKILICPILWFMTKYLQNQ